MRFCLAPRIRGHNVDQMHGLDVILVWHCARPRHGRSAFDRSADHGFFAGLQTQKPEGFASPSFEAAVNEIIEKIAPERIVVETTGLAEPEALMFNIQEALPQCRLDGVVSVIDADMLIRFPELGHTTRLQIEGADILLLNKIDLVEPEQIKPLETKLREINPIAAIVRTERCRIDPELLFGVGRERKIAAAEPGSPIPATAHRHQPEFESFAFTSSKIFSRDCFEDFANGLPAGVVRAKGFIRFADGAQLFNFVAGRWELEPFEFDRTELVFIGRKIAMEKEEIIDALNKCGQAR